ncbi:MAG TPA: sigma-70 family RNA polymerase sigma factor [Ktedonobacterales bacterium]|jgi:RNA polymerase sigma-70 factor (ECF subfamily)
MRERDGSAGPPAFSLAAFSRVVEHHQQGLYAFLRGMVRHDEQARDLTQDTFSLAWRAAQAGTPPFTSAHAPDDIRRWLYHTAYCRGISALRRQKLIRWESLEGFAEGGLPIVLPDARASFEEQIAEGEALRAALARLAPQDAACLLLRVVQGFSAAEVAQIVGASAEVVTKRLSRAKQRLRAAYLAGNHDTAETAACPDPAPAHPVEERLRR